MVQRGRNAGETPAVVGGLAACQSLGVLEDGGEREQKPFLVHPLLLLFRVPAGVCEQALHRTLVGGSVVVDYLNGQNGEEREGRKGGLARIWYALVVRSGLAATRLVLSVHRVTTIVFSL